MATRFYFHNATSGLANLPTAEQSTALTALQNVDAQTVNRTMEPEIGVGPQVQLRIVTPANTSANTYYVTRFVSPAINQTSIAANTWTWNFAYRESNANANYPTTTTGATPVCCYVWRPGTGKVGDILDSATGVATIAESTTGITAVQVTFSGSAVASTQLGDVICFEVWFRTTQGTAASRNDDFFFDGTTVATSGTVTNHASFLETPENIVFGPRLFARSVSASVTVSATADRARTSHSGTQSLKCGVITKDTTTGVHTQNFTNEAGFAPQWGIFIMSGKTAAGSGAHMQNSIGFTDGTNHYCLTRRCIDGNNSSGTSIANHRSSSTYTMALDATTSSAVTLSEGVVIFGSNGWDINWLKADAVANKIIYMVGGGGGFDDAIVKSQAVGATPWQYTNIGMQGDIVFFIASTTPINTNKAGQDIGLGAATSSSARWCTGHSTNSGFPTVGSRFQRTDNVVKTNINGTAARALGDFTSFLSNGYDLNFTSSTAADTFGALVIKGGLWDLGTFNQNTSNGTQQVNITAGRTPTGVFLSTFGDAATTSNLNDARLSVGVMSSTVEASIWDGFANADASNYKSRSDFSDTKVIRTLDEGVGTQTLQTEADFSSFQSGSFTINNTTTDATSREICYVAFTPEPVVGGVHYDRTASETVQLGDTVAALRRVPKTASAALTIAAVATGMYKSRRTASAALTVLGNAVSLRRVPVPTSASLTVTAAITKLYLRRLVADTLTVNGAVTILQKLRKSVSETLTVTAIPVSLTKFRRTLSESLTIIAAPTRFFHANRSVSESATIAATPVRLFKAMRSTSESLIISASAAAISRFFRTLSESLTIDTTAVGAKITGAFFEVAVNETLTLADTVVRFYRANKNCAELVSINDSLIKVFKSFRSLTESPTITGSVVKLRRVPKTVSESLQVNASVVRFARAVRTLNESLTVNAAITRFQRAPRSLTESLTVVANVVRLFKATRTTSETPVIASANVVRFYRANRSVVASLTIAVVAAKISKFYEALAESVIITADVTRIPKLTRFLTESVIVTATVTRFQRAVRTLSANISVNAVSVTVKRQFRNLSETFTINTLVTRGRKIPKAISVSFTIVADIVVDARTITYVAVSESVTITDSVIRKVCRFLPFLSNT